MTTTVGDTDEIVQQIAAETNTSTDVVSKRYALTMAKFGDGAVVHDFVLLFAAKRLETLKPVYIDSWLLGRDGLELLTEYKRPGRH